MLLRKGSKVYPSAIASLPPSVIAKSIAKFQSPLSAIPAFAGIQRRARVKEKRFVSLSQREIERDF